MPAAPVAEPPSAPIVTPPAPTIAPSSPSSSKPPGPAPLSSASSSDDNLMADGFGDLDNLSKPKPPPAPTKPPVKPDETKAKSDFESETETEKPAEPQKALEAKQPSKPATLRAAYENVKRRNQELEQQIKQSQQVKPPTEDPRLKTYMERLEAAEKRREELEGEIRYSAYERSPEYQEKYQKPFEDAYQWGRQAVARLKVIQEDGATRSATPEDFDKIMLIPDDGDAVDVAEQMFGNKSKIVLDHRWEMKKLDAARYRAIEDYRKQGSERQLKMTESESKQREQIGKMWGELNNQAAERFPKWFKPEDGDEDGNKLLEDGYKLADAAFSNGNGMPQEQLVRLHASIRNRAAAFSREVYRNTKLNERVSELEKELEQFKASEPGPGDGGGPKGDTNEFDELMADA